jgi:hypothetical protein
MENQTKTNQKLQFLYAELDKLEETYSPERRKYLLDEIDYQELQLLKTRTQDHYKEIQNE